MCDKCSPHRLEMPDSYGYGGVAHRICSGCWEMALTIRYEEDLAVGRAKPPDYEKLRAELQSRAEKYLALPESGWVTKVDRNVKMSTQALPWGDPIMAVRCEVSCGRSASITD